MGSFEGKNEHSSARNAHALSEVEQRGWRLFSGKAGCVACHSVNERHALLADGKFHVTGVGFMPPARSYVVPLAPGVQTELTSADLAAFDQEYEAESAGVFCDRGKKAGDEAVFDETVGDLLVKGLEFDNR